MLCGVTVTIAFRVRESQIVFLTRRRNKKKTNAIKSFLFLEIRNKNRFSEYVSPNQRSVCERDADKKEKYSKKQPKLLDENGKRRVPHIITESYKHLFLILLCAQESRRQHDTIIIIIMGE